MCGIAGIFSPGRVDKGLLASMAGAIAHRGPDDQGIWSSGQVGVGFASRRLAIIDLSPAGHQPMLSADGRYVICFNGEIYNHAAIRRELEAIGSMPAGGWRGRSDTEVLLQAIATWGLEEALSRSVGMFAFALWDQKERRLSLVRDRFGEKPLYYGWAGKDLVFGSELKSLRCHPEFSRAISRRAVGVLAARAYVPAPLSIYRSIFKLPPASILTLTEEAISQPLVDPPKEQEAGPLQLKRYWSYRDVLRKGIADPIADEDEAVNALEDALAASIQAQSYADVPVGAFLSGGIDSSTLVGLYQKYSTQLVRTYSIGFEQGGFDEATHARAVARHFGTVHHEHYVTVDEARDVIPLLPAIYDEPFGDSSQIPTFLVSRFARGGVTVAMSGDGGDELFGGYNRHVIAPHLWRRLRLLPQPVRSILGSQLARLSPSAWSKLATLVDRQEQPLLGARMQRGFRTVGSAQSFEDICLGYLDEWRLEANPVGDLADLPDFDFDLGEGAGDAERLMYCDATSFLPDDILTKVDRASMAVSLEVRAPYLDHRVAELAARIPLSMKIRNRKGKHILRQLLYREAPKELFDRPKAGFAVPVGEWIKGPLRPWAEELLDARRLAEDGWFNPEIVQRRWSDHLAGKRDSTAALWSVLMFQAWLREEQSPPGNVHGSQSDNCSAATRQMEQGSTEHCQ